MPTFTLGIDIGGTAIKAVLLRDGAAFWSGRSAEYVRPDVAALRQAAGEALTGCPAGATVAGLCLPGLYDAAAGVVTCAVNVPGIEGLSIDGLLASVLRAPPTTVMVLTDARAAAHDIYTSRRLRGRLLALVLGTGVGAAVLDDGAVLRGIDGDSPGHLGRCDVSRGDDDVVGPDGGAGGLEGYLGAPAIRARYGAPVSQVLPRLTVADPPIRALVRILRIAHAIYRPQHICLAGGIGIRLAHLMDAIHAGVSHRLTSIARPRWTLTRGDSDHQAAIGAAKLAMASSAR